MEKKKKKKDLEAYRKQGRFIGLTNRNEFTAIRCVCPENTRRPVQVQFSTIQTTPRSRNHLVRPLRVSQTIFRSVTHRPVCFVSVCPCATGRQQKRNRGATMLINIYEHRNTLHTIRMSSFKLGLYLRLKNPQKRPCGLPHDGEHHILMSCLGLISEGIHFVMGS